MSFAAVRAASLLGVQGEPVVVEVHVGMGLPGFSIVGQPDEACRESRDRVRAALLSSDLPWPNRRITVNLATGFSDRKGGAGLDLAIAVGLLVVQGVIEQTSIEAHGFVAELGLDGSLRAVPGLVPLVAAVDAGSVVVAHDAVGHARVAARGDVLGARDLADVLSCLRGEGQWSRGSMAHDETTDTGRVCDLADVRGQPAARRALEIAAAGGHHLLLVGPPGAGKSMLARRLVTLLPPLTEAEAASCTVVHSAANVGLPRSGVVSVPPLRAPHHSTSLVAMVGGGTSAMRPGEVSLATHGVLFLDELGEFAPSVLDALRQPLEEGVVRLARARHAVTMPARFLLVAATNPCPCGEGTPGACVCDDRARARYVRRFSGPLLDRFDLRVAVARPEVNDMLGASPGESSATVAARVLRARAIAAERSGGVNAELDGDALERFAPLDAEALALLRSQMERGRLSGRGYHRIRRVARTVADLDGEPGVVRAAHVAVALALRVELRRGLEVSSA